MHPKGVIAAMKVKKYNFSKIISAISIILSMIVILNFTTMLFTMQNLSKGAAELNKEEFKSDIAGVNENLNAIQSMMLAELSSDNELDKLLEEKSDRNLQISEYATIKRLNTLMANWSGDLRYNVQYAIYLPSNKIEMNSCVQGDEFTVWRGIKQQLYKDIDTLHYKSGWQIMNLNGKNYLVDIIQKNTICSISYIEVKDVFQFLKNKVYGKNYYFALKENKTVYDGKKQLIEDKIESKNLKTGLSILDMGTLAIKSDLQDDISIMLVVHDYNRETSVFNVQIFMLIMLAVVVGMVILFIGIINKTILYPISKFNENVESLKSTETYDPKTHFQIKELENASDLMHDMVVRIKKLKIDIYEKTLEQQKTKMDFLSLQIEPHFYLNCLNNIFSMAQMHQYADIQKLVGCVSVYLRYIFKSSDVLVSAKDELYHIEKYLEIQKMRYQSGFSYYIDVDEKLLNTKMPPLILQIFVENSLKHTVNWEDEIEIRITGYQKEKAYFVIEDTGDGFSEEILKKLQNKEDISEGEKHIGITNAIARMAMTFGEEGKITFENVPGGGARVLIEMPFLEEAEVATGDTMSVFDEKR